VSYRNVVFLAVSVLMAALFARLGVWQLHRLGERRARNALVTARLATPPVALAALPRDTAMAHFRRAHLAGTLDFDHEVVLVNRIRDGAPGVHLVTPLRPDTGTWGGGGGDTAVLVDRGWVYAPDGASVDRARWREPSRFDGTGYVQEFTAGRGSPAAVPSHPERLRWLDPDAVSHNAGYPIARYYVVVDVNASKAAPGVPVRVPVPTLDDGPHLSYAIQWFSFAVIALVGALFAVFGRSRRATLPSVS
jgi:surfeit locus 1 family protein